MVRGGEGAEFLIRDLLNGSGLGGRALLTGARWGGDLCWFIAQPLAQLRDLVAEAGDFMLGIRIGGPCGKPSLDVFSNGLCRILGVGGLVQCLPILSSPNLGDPVQVNASAAQLRGEFRCKHP